MSTRVHFGILGPLEVTYDGAVLDLGRPKQRAVLAALLLAPNRVVSLDRFVDLLWPEGAVASTASLPVYVANLRRLLEPDRPARTPPQRLLTRPPGYLLRIEPGELDAADFEALAAEGSRRLAGGEPRAARQALGDALALWRGRPLEEFPFAELDAARLERLRVAAIEDRIEADLALGAHHAVAGELESLVKQHGLRERLVGLLMVALYRSGRQVEALRAYTEARRYLAEELGIEPGPQLRRLEADVLAQSPDLDWRPPAPEGVPRPVHIPPQPAAVTPDPFVGRAAELAAVDGAIDAIGPGAGAIVVVYGEPGIGKTRLAREAAARAAARGCTVLWSRCEEGDGAPPFWPWIQVVRGLLGHPDTEAVTASLAGHASAVAQLVPEVKELVGDVGAPPALDPAGARFRLFDAIAGVLEAFSRRAPLAVVLDDLQWADAPSLELTALLARRLEGMHALLLATYRNVDPAPVERMTATLASVARQPRRLDLSLAGLSEDEVAQFIAQQAGAEPPPAVVAAVWERAAGNPFFVGELTRLLVAEKSLTEDAARSTAVPWAVRQVVERRIDRLPESTRRLLTVAAVMGREFDLRVVATAAGTDIDQALDVVDVAQAAGVVTEGPVAVERFQFSHFLVHETVYQSVTGLRRARLHGQVADALVAHLADRVGVAELAHHLYEAAPVIGPARGIAAAVRASEAAQAALAYEAAEDHLHRALALVGTMASGRERDRLELDVQDHLAALLTLVKGVAVPETAAAWARATELCHEVEDRRRLFPSLWGMFSFAWASGDLDGARAMAEHILHLGRASSEPVVDAAAHLGLGAVALCRGDLGEGAGHLRRGKALADGLPDDTLADVTYADIRVQTDSWLAMALHLQGEHAEARRIIDAAADRARALGDTFTVALGLSFAVFARVLSGAVGEARALADELLEHAERHQLPDFAVHAGVARVWTIAQTAPGPDVPRLIEALPPAGEAGIRPWRPFWFALLAEAWQRLGRGDEAQRALDDAFAEVAAMGSASFCLAELHRLRGELAAPGPDAVSHLAQAVRRATEQGAALYRERAEAALRLLS